VYPPAPAGAVPGPQGCIVILHDSLVGYIKSPREQVIIPFTSLPERAARETPRKLTTPLIDRATPFCRIMRLSCVVTDKEHVVTLSSSIVG
jgi:hypothetical protein